MKSLLFCVVWLFLSALLLVPVSYFFQKGPLQIMGLLDYVIYFPKSMMAGAMYGAASFFLYTWGVVFVIGAAIIIFLIENYSNNNLISKLLNKE